MPSSSSSSTTSSVSTLSIERHYLSDPSACVRVVGCDEAGRGPLCGPVVVAACDLQCDAPSAAPVEGVGDSKQLSAEARETVFARLLSMRRPTEGRSSGSGGSRPRANGVAHFVHVLGPDVIDRVNILQASMQGMAGTVEDLLRAEGETRLPRCLALLDGPRVPRCMRPEGVQVKPVVKGDATVHTIAAASVLAKVVRDRIMEELDDMYPGYDWAQNKGYPTSSHFGKVRQLGPCAVHRSGFNPIKPYRLDISDEERKAIREEQVRATREATARALKKLPDNLNVRVIAVEDLPLDDEEEEQEQDEEEDEARAPKRRGKSNSTARAKATAKASTSKGRRRAPVPPPDPPRPVSHAEATQQAEATARDLRRARREAAATRAQRVASRSRGSRKRQAPPSSSTTTTSSRTSSSGSNRSKGETVSSLQQPRRTTKRTRTR